ncbi:MAG: hypothetical protein HQM16_16235 [Deltaproteobacteria bacterium]|nr:hypothetical protein [Deltaproteobacteria bacterium]
MDGSRSLAELFALKDQKDTGIILRVSDAEKNSIKQIAESKGFTLSDFVRDAVYYYTWATSEIELSVLKVNSNPEYIDLINKASYPVYLANFIITDDTFDKSNTVTNKHRHSFHFAPLVFKYISGALDRAILYPHQIVRVYTGTLPVAPPQGVSIWTTLRCKNKIWNDAIDRVTIYRVAREKSEDVIAGVPIGTYGGLRALINR